MCLRENIVKKVRTEWAEFFWNSVPVSYNMKVIGEGGNFKLLGVSSRVQACQLKLTIKY